MTALPSSVDCLIIGAGPAGLTAATYLARFRRSVALVDGGASRAAWIPVSHNLIGYAEGISGPALLEQMRRQADRYGVTVVSGTVDSLVRCGDGDFTARVGDREIAAARVLLATGGLDVEPELPDIRDAVRKGLVRYCPICDAYEAAGRKVALIAYGECRVKEALLLRGYTADLTILSLGYDLALAPQDRRQLDAAGIAIIDHPVTRLATEGDRISAWHLGSGDVHRFDVVYSALGTRMRSGLATALGAEADETGALVAGSHQETAVPGLYAAGDVVQGLSQVNVAAAHGAIAATAINRSLPAIRFAA
jgi:thioredoxin reductase (NADPH)